jgi:phage terminase large subunit-like protein
VYHCGVFAKLEDQLCTLTSDFDARASGFSPDRADALVWAISDLLSPGGRQAQTLLDYYARQARGEN